MNLTIQCPQCGFIEFKALNTETNYEVTITISKCETTHCSLDIPEDEFYYTFEFQEDLCLPSNYKIISQTLSKCFKDNSLN